MKWQGERMNEILENLKLYGDILLDEPMSKHTTYKVGGNAACFIYPSSLVSLMRIMELAKQQNIPVKIIGKGSNILASDDQYEGIICCLDRYFIETHFENNGTCYAMAGVSIIYLAFEAMKQGLGGLEFASGIPGTVAGACFMNAGAYKSEMSHIVEAVLVLKNGQCSWMRKEECEFSYRSSIFQKNPDWVILALKLKLYPKDSNEIKEIMDSRRERRMASQPLNMPSAGSVFQNPVDIPAWQLIEQAGLRGYRINGAMVSDKHANFIVNADQAKAEDILNLMQLIQKKVKEASGYELKTEVELFNWKN